MMKTLLAAALALPLVPVFASSYYTNRLEDAKAVYLTSDKLRVKADGQADDTAGLQQAINQVQETTTQGIVFIPSGRYRLTETIYIWPGVRLIGFGRTRPSFVLAANTPGFQKGPAYMIFFTGDRPAPGVKPEDANPGTFYS